MTYCEVISIQAQWINTQSFHSMHIRHGFINDNCATPLDVITLHIHKCHHNNFNGTKYGTKQKHYEYWQKFLVSLIILY